MSKGKLIVIEGLDGSGKATQSALLCEALAAGGKSVNKLSFPCYDDDSSALVRMYLAGRFGENPDDVNCFAGSVFFSVDRYASYKANWENGYISGGTYIADRYTTSNAVFQTSKLPKEQWDSYLDWLFDFEYHKMGIPEPDLVIYLDVEPEVSEKLVESRYHGDEAKKDIHERDDEYQHRCREAALYCANKLGWHRISCQDGSAMRSKEDIANDVLKAVNAII